MRPTDEEIEKQMTNIYDKQRKLYWQYKIKSFFRIPTKGLNSDNSLILNSILHDNKNDNYCFVVINNIDKTDQEDIREYHKTALRIDENSYVSILFNVNQQFGDYVIGDNLNKKLSPEFLKRLKSEFKSLISNQYYIKATEYLIKSINRKLANA